jgi:hypothetical protein
MSFPRFRGQRDYAASAATNHAAREQVEQHRQVQAAATAAPATGD